MTTERTTPTVTRFNASLTVSILSCFCSAKACLGLSANQTDDLFISQDLKILLGFHMYLFSVISALVAGSDDCRVDLTTQSTLRRVVVIGAVQIQLN